MGGKCCICGYDRYNGSLALHHLDPSEKDHGIGKILSHPRSWDIIVTELRKCILVCLNCHGEIHANVTQIPSSPPRFNESFVDYKEKEEETEPCPICGNPKRLSSITCSRECAAKKRMKIDWNNIDLKGMYGKKTIVKIAEEIGCSDVAVRKRMVKLGIITTSTKKKSTKKSKQVVVF